MFFFLLPLANMLYTDYNKETVTMLMNGLPSRFSITGYYAVRVIDL